MICDSCIHKAVCKDYPSEGIPPLTRERILNKGCDHFADMDEMIKLPCKIGDTVYEPNITLDFVSIYKVTSIILMSNSRNYNWELIYGVYSNINGFNEYALGKHIFLTESEAIAKLAEMRERK